MVNCIFSDVSERDMDLLFLEEFVSSEEFLHIFLSKISLENANICSVEQSKTDVQFGESDMTVIVEKGGIKYGLLIEDKIDAIAMQNQSRRYMDRGELGKKNGDYQQYFVFIVAPQSYLQQNDEAKKYPHQVTYEECLQHFLSKKDNRSNFKAQQIEQAIHKQKHGYQVVEHAAVTDFWDKYITYKEQHYPNLWLVSKRVPKGFNARWPYYNTVFKNIVIHHKSESGFVDMEIPGVADKIILLEKYLTNLLGDLSAKGVVLVKTGKSVALRVTVPELDFAQPFNEHESEITKCFEAIEKLSELAKEISIVTQSTFLDF